MDLRLKTDSGHGKPNNTTFAGKAVVFLLLLTVVAMFLPIWPYSQTWGYIPAMLAAVALIGLMLLLFRGTPHTGLSRSRLS